MSPRRSKKQSPEPADPSPSGTCDPQAAHRYWRSFAKALMAATGHGVVALNAEGAVIRANAQAHKIFGLAPGRQLPDMLPDLWRAALEVMAAERSSAETPIESGGHTYRAWITRIPAAEGQHHLICTLEDRSELEEVASRMRSYQELSQELRAIIASSDDGLWICDAEGKVLRINEASERINMVLAEDVIGRSMYDLQEEGFIDRSVTLEVLKTKRRSTILQRIRSGRKLMLTGNPVFDASGELIRVVVNERDITEIDALRRKLEEQVAIKDKMRHQMLEMQLAEMTANSIIARSPAMVSVIQQALKLGQVRTTALILGESGTGKGIIAKLIHKHSDRAKNPMISINCGAIPENLVETELFGYQRGAFTGADQKGKAGYIELAHRGSLFLDEIAELPLASQVKLLRFLENGRVTRVGGTASRTVDVRILCATHQDLEEMVAAGRFRKDLYYRLHVVPLRVPPLRERKECILPLLQHYLAHFDGQLKGERKTRLSREALDALIAYTYPGNVRELLNLCERLVVMGEGREITRADLPTSVLREVERSVPIDTGSFRPGRTLAEMMAAVERRILADAHREYGSQAKMAEVLGVNQSTIARKMKKYR